MSTPPPPPYATARGPVPPGQYDRRFLRAQREAAAAQARWQRKQMRMQMQAARRTSAVGPLLVLGLGVVLLLLETGRLHWPDVLYWLGRWWPGVLIFSGLLMLAEWALDRQQIARTGTAIAPRRTLGASAVAVLMLLAFAGLCVVAAQNGSGWAKRNFGPQFASDGLEDWRKVFGVRSDFSQDMSTPLAPTGTLNIESQHGSIQVTGTSEDGKVHVAVHQHLYTWHKDEVDIRRRSELPTLSGDQFHATLRAPTDGQDTADLIVELPHEASVILRSSHGDITVDQLRGSVDIDSGDGDVKLTGLSGSVQVKTHDDNATVVAHSLGNGFKLEGRSGDVKASDIEGAVSLEGEFFGTTHLEHIAGTVSFHSSFTQFTCAGIPGQLNIEGRSDLDAEQLEGPVKLATTDRNITLNGVRGGATVTDSNGAVLLQLAGQVQPVKVVDTNGPIHVAVPAGQGFEVQARAENGQIQNDFGLSNRATDNLVQLTGRVRAGGPTVDLQTSEADITLRIAAPGPASWDRKPVQITKLPETSTPDSK